MLIEVSGCRVCTPECSGRRRQLRAFGATVKAPVAGGAEFGGSGFPQRGWHGRMLHKGTLHGGKLALARKRQLCPIPRVRRDKSPDLRVAERHSGEWRSQQETMNGEENHKAQAQKPSLGTLPVCFSAGSDRAFPSARRETKKPGQSTRAFGFSVFTPIVGARWRKIR